MSIINYGWDLDNNINRIFDDFIKDLNVARRSENRTGIANFNPAIDVHENENEFTINAELPVRIFFSTLKKYFFLPYNHAKTKFLQFLKGLKKDQINVDVHDNTLVISGELKRDEKYKEGNTHIKERRYGSFTRGISLPPNVKADDITAKFENGLLELKLPKTAPTGKKITVQ
jgi:HSP20 family protein